MSGRERPAGLREAVPGLRRTLRQLRPHIREQRTLIAGGGAALLAEVAMRLLEPWPLKWVLDAVVVAAGADLAVRRPDDLGTLLLLASVGVVVVVLLRAAASYLMTVAFALAGNRVLTRVRAEVYAHLHRLSLAFHDSSRTGDLVTRVTGDVGRLQEATVTALLPLLGNVVTLVGMLVVIAVLDLQLALVVLLVFPLFAVSGVRLTRRISAVSRGQRKAEGALASLATESLSSMKVVQAYSLERPMQEAFGGDNERSLTEGVQAKKLSAGLERTTDALVGLATGVVLYVGAQRVLAGALTPGELVVFLTYLKTAFKPLRDIAKYTGRIAKAAASGERIVDVLQTRPDLVDRSWARPAPRFRGDVRFEGVHLSYAPGHPVLRGLDLTVRPGERVAVVGPSGSGKSSLVSLLSRLRDPDDGRVLLDGHDVRDLTIDSVREQVAVVLQESVLFATSIRDNIAYGRPGATEEEVVAAARLAGADGFVRRLPRGYDTVVGERGSTLSGGQRQRIAIARAALRDAPVVILDEALTGLDGETEAEVVAALGRLTRGRTTFVITHDLDAARDCDRVVRVEDGRAREVAQARAAAPAREAEREGRDAVAR
ncbi:ABC transporter ATP-binding protein [Cellulomonas pakistanensis]|uniref:Protein-tyrosine-phosphatase n=1 Tax=Cellulomonas pakistanensis TaxID=992287 RepID=A0A919U5P4_9CELL|nr:ABC transporter ATP-binding protein [Cellulomonas pakistanensis]GIG35217.1 protein-tyrosine-phosphatase [Cellulomonas pakistanensis]